MTLFLLLTLSAWAELRIESCLQAETLAPLLLVRKEPLPDGSITGKLPAGSSFRMRVFDNDWAEILSGPDQGEFTSLKHLKLSLLETSECSTKEFAAEVARPKVNLRPKPGDVSTVAGSATQGASLTVQPATKGWLKVLAPEPWHGTYLRADLVRILDEALPQRGSSP